MNPTDSEQVRRTRYVASCPGCDSWRNLGAMPQPGAWPRCLVCTETMNVYERPRRALAAQPSEKPHADS